MADVPAGPLSSFEKTVATISATLVLSGMIYKPLREWWNGVTGRWLVRMLKRCKREIRAVLREEVLVAEMTQLDKHEDGIDVNKNRLDFVEASIMEHGKSLSVLPGLAAKLEGLPDAIEHLSSTMIRMSENVGEIRGAMKERERREAEDRNNRRQHNFGPPDGYDDRRAGERRHFDPVHLPEQGPDSGDGTGPK